LKQNKVQHVSEVLFQDSILRTVMARLVVDIESRSGSDDEFPGIEELAGTRGKNVLAKVNGPVRGKAEKAVDKNLTGEGGENSGVGGGGGGGVRKVRARKRVLKQTADNPLLRRFDGTSSELLGEGLRRKGRAVGLKDKKAAVGREEVVLELESCGGKKTLGRVEDEGSKDEEKPKSSSDTLIKSIESDNHGVSQARKAKRQPKTTKGKEIREGVDVETEEVRIHPKSRSTTVQSNESEDEDISQVRKAKTRQTSKKVDVKIKEVTALEQGRLTTKESTEDEDSNQKRKTVKTRQARKPAKKVESRSPPKAESDEEDFGLDSDGLSDFIVDDSTFLEEEDTIIEEPAPRSVRRLIKGRRQNRVEDSDDEESGKQMGKVKIDDISTTLEKALRHLDLDDSEDEGEPKTKFTSKDIHSKVPRRGRDDKAPPASSDIDNPFTLR
jgi:hypothetical protein